jgi:hypothetical protein
MKTSIVESRGLEIQDIPGEFAYLRKNDLSVDENYQRRPDDNKVNKIARSWSWLACGALVVARRGGRYWVIDGWHRKKAADRLQDIEELPCMIFGTVAMSEEAEGFLDINVNRKPVRPVEKFKTMLAKGDKTAVLAQELIEQANRRPSADSSPSTVSCIAALLRWCRSFPDAIERIWPLICDVCYGYPMLQQLVSGLMYIETRMAEGTSLSAGQWQRRTTKVGHERLVDSARRASMFYEEGGDRVWAIGIVEAINKGLRIKLPVNIDMTIRNAFKKESR